MQLLTPNDQTMVSFVSGQLNNVSLALAMAKRGNMPGAEQLVVQEFEQLMQGNQFKEAAECAADSPQVRVEAPGLVRTIDKQFVTCMSYWRCLAFVGGVNWVYGPNLQRTPSALKRICATMLHTYCSDVGPLPAA